MIAIEISPLHAQIWTQELETKPALHTFEQHISTLKAFNAEPTNKHKTILRHKIYIYYHILEILTVERKKTCDKKHNEKEKTKENMKSKWSEKVI